MIQDLYSPVIRTHLFAIAAEIEASTATNHNDIAVDSENFFAALLNLAFGFALRNLNKGKSNVGVLDLADDQLKIGVQVTAYKNHKKKKESILAGFKKGGLSAKYEKLYILFIAKDCPNNLLPEDKSPDFTYEGWDMAKIVRKIQEELPDDKKSEIVSFLDKARAPLRISHKTYPAYLKIYNPLFFNQVKPRSKGQFYLKRKELAKSIHNFIQEGNGLLLGDPGVGKSFVIEELCRFYKSKRVPCCLIKLNGLVKGTDNEISAELGLGGSWLDFLAMVPPVTPQTRNVLILDGFDTLKDESIKRDALWQIKNSLAKLNPGWHVLLSCRTYDAGKARNLKDLFRSNPPTQDSNTRFLTVENLSSQELGDILMRQKGALDLYQRCSANLQAVLKTPFFLNIFLEIISRREKSTSNFKGIETEEQLLRLYWRKLDLAETGTEVFLHSLCTRLLRNLTLSCEKVDVVSPVNTLEFEHLLSDGIIEATGVHNRYIGFRHNILNDYAISRLLLPDKSQKLIATINANERLPFLYRSSFFYFYSHLWRLHRNIFWDHYKAVTAIDLPVFRLFHQLVLNPVVASLFLNTEDMNPILDGSGEKKGSSIRKFLEALRFISDDVNHKHTLILLKSLSFSFTTEYIWQLGFLINKSIKSTVATKSASQRRFLSEISGNYLNRLLLLRRNSAEKNLVDGNGANWGMTNLLELYSFKKAENKKIVKNILTLLSEPEFPMIYFTILSHKFEKITPIDPALAAVIYKTLYLFVETSDSPTYLGTPTFGLRSNRKQDYQSCVYGLENHYNAFLRDAPENAVKTGIYLVNHYKLGAKSYLPRPFIYKVNIAGIPAKLIKDYSFEDSDLRQEDGYESHVSKIIAYFSELIEGNKKSLLISLLRIYTKDAKASTLWRVLLLFLAENIELLHATCFQFLCNPAFILCDETIYESAVLLKAYWPFAETTNKTVLRSMIIKIGNQKKDKAQKKYAERKVSRMLGCIPESELTHEELAYLNEVGHRENVPIISRQSYFGPANISREEQLIRQGIEPPNLVLEGIYESLKQIESFNNKYLSSNSPEFTSDEYEPLLAKSEKLFEDLKAKVIEFPSQLRISCDYAISAFAHNISKKEEIIFGVHRNFIKTIALHYIDDPRYYPSAYEAETKSSIFSFSPTARTNAGEIMIRLFNLEITDEVRTIILSMLKDNSKVLRHAALSALIRFWHIERPLFWNVIREQIAVETDIPCACLLLDSFYYTDVIEEDTVNVTDSIALASSILPKLSYQQDYVFRFLNIAILLKLKMNNNILFSKYDDHHAAPEFARAVVFKIFEILDPHNPQLNLLDLPHAYDDLIDLLHKIITQSLATISENANGIGLQQGLETIDRFVDQLYYTVVFGKGENRGQEISDFRKQSYFNKIRPVLSQIIAGSTAIEHGFMLAKTGYHFMIVLNAFLPFDPGWVLDKISEVVSCAVHHQLNYDKAAMNEVLKLAESILANHKYILDDPGHFKNLLIILDHFTDAGWMEALELIWRLKEIF